MTKNLMMVRGKNDNELANGAAVGSNVKRIRRLLGITQVEFARDAFIDRRRLSKIENNELVPTIDEVTEFCKILQVSVMALCYNVCLDEVHCDEKTGLSVNSIRWLTKLNRENHSFIKMINILSTKQTLFDVVYEVIKPIVKRGKDVL